MNLHRILVAEDHPGVRRLVERILCDAGHTVESCPDGDLAWDKLKEGDFSLLITDQNMPGKTGHELILGLRSRGSRIPVLLMSADACPTMDPHGQSGDSFLFLEKPFAPDTLHTAIHRLCSQ